MSIKDKKTERPRVTYVCLGKRPLKGGKVGFLYHRVSSLDEAKTYTAAYFLGDLGFGLSDDEWNAWKGARDAFGGRKGMGHVGAVITVETNEDGTSVFPESATVIGWVDDDVRATLQEAAKAIENETALEKEVKKRGDAKLAEERYLAPLRETYRHLANGRQKTLFIGRIIEYITRGH